eukprot:Rhum_TRINITY_DN8991_c1_g1::Rhum_TRINITY_DN8991_c1_g1_i1::g.30990::m.30990
MQLDPLHGSSPVVGGGGRSEDGDKRSVRQLPSSSSQEDADGCLARLKMLIHSDYTGEGVRIAEFLRHHRSAAHHRSSLDGTTALHAAVQDENEAACRMLLRKRADPNAQAHD